MTSPKKTIILIVCVVAYMTFGMLVFYHIEKPHEEQLLKNRIPLENITAKFKESNPLVNAEALTDLLLDVLETHSNGGLQWHGAAPERWTYTSSIYFSVTVITTIGYGNVVPRTSAGRIFCTFYAFVGIPLCMLLLINLGAQLYEKCQKTIDLAFEKCNIKLTPIFKVIKTTVIVFVLGLTIFLFVPALIFVQVETDWSFADACYFAFISISTIGFGDLVAGKTASLSSTGMSWYRAGITLWIFLGLAWLSTLVSAVQNTMQHLLEKGEKKIEHKLSEIKKHHESSHLKQKPAEQLGGVSVSGSMYQLKR